MTLDEFRDLTKDMPGNAELWLKRYDCDVFISTAVYNAKENSIDMADEWFKYRFSSNDHPTTNS